jgi:molybdopterin converting factor small subunit
MREEKKELKDKLKKALNKDIDKEKNIYDVDNIDIINEDNIVENVDKRYFLNDGRELIIE